MSKFRDQPRKGAGRSDGGQFTSKGGPRAAPATTPKVDLSTSTSLKESTSLALITNYPKNELIEAERSLTFKNLQIGELRHTPFPAHYTSRLQQMLSNVELYTRNEFEQGLFNYDVFRQNAADVALQVVPAFIDPSSIKKEEIWRIRVNRAISFVHSDYLDSIKQFALGLEEVLKKSKVGETTSIRRAMLEVRQDRDSSRRTWFHVIPNDPRFSENIDVNAFSELMLQINEQEDKLASIEYDETDYYYDDLGREEIEDWYGHANASDFLSKNNAVCSFTIAATEATYKEGVVDRTQVDIGIPSHYDVLGKWIREDLLDCLEVIYEESPLPFLDSIQQNSPSDVATILRALHQIAAKNVEHLDHDLLNIILILAKPPYASY